MVKHHIQMEPEVVELLQEISKNVQGIGRCIGSRMGHDKVALQDLIDALGHAQSALKTTMEIQYPKK